MADGRKKLKPKPAMTKAQLKKLSEKMKGNKNAVGNEGGRPTLCTPQLIKLVHGLTLALYPVEKICEAVDISVPTFYKWKKEIPEFSKALHDATTGLDNKLLRSLKRKALGYKINAVKVMKVKDDATGADKIVNHVYQEYYPPDTRSQEILLRNRPSLKERWSSIPDVDPGPIVPTTIDLNNVDLSKLSDSAIKEIIAASKRTESKG